MKLQKFARGFKKAMAMVMILTMVVANFTPVYAEELPELEFLFGVREGFEGIGGTVEWQGEDRSIRIDFLGYVIILFTESPEISVDGDYFPLETGVIFIDNRAFLTMRDVMRMEIALMGGTLETFYLTEEARDIVLYDFNYAINFILENSPWDSVIYRRLGINFDMYVEMFREFIENMIPLESPALPGIFPIREGTDARSLAANYLISLLAFEFSQPLQGIGHIGPRDLELYRMQLTGMLRSYHGAEMSPEMREYLGLRLAAFIHPAAIWFYGEYEVDLYGEDHPFPDVPGNIITEILVPGEVAYLRINTFMANPEYDDNTTLPFLQEIRDFDHLIIDVRGNMGGLAGYFDEFIIRRLISEPVEFPGGEFFRAGDAAMATMNALIQVLENMEPDEYAVTEIMYVGKMPAAEFVEQRGMVYFNPDDLARLDYVIYSRSRIAPSDDSIGFGGEIWLLIDHMSMSASVNAALSVMAIGGTLVGTNTSGVLGPMHMYTTLPNTGIIWRLDIGYIADAYGRSLEVYGVAPHFTNLPGLDALETALVLITMSE
ncbi:MAG: S41 family peptidase [Defluviitaleaceae bacterium]|nr:S41 family peptidase [Defluviitaleaceae bacterium]